MELFNTFKKHGLYTMETFNLEGNLFHSKLLKTLFYYLSIGAAEKLSVLNLASISIFSC